MIISNELKPESLASHDVTRPYIQHAYLDTEKSRLLVTNGQAAAIIPVGLSEGDTAGPISGSALKAARKADKKKVNAEIQSNGALVISDGTSLPRPSLDGMTYPDIDRIMPAARETADIALSPELLLDLANAMGCKYVTLTFGRDADGNIDPRQCIRVEPNAVDTGCVGAIMPVRF